MSKSRTVRTAVGLPLAAALTFATTSCLPGNDATQAKPSTPSTPSKSAVATNGIEKLEGAAAVNRALKATKDARTLRLRGQITDSGETIGMDFRYAERNRAGGTLRIGAQRIELIRLGSVVYFKGNKPFLQEIGGADAVTTMTGKYVKVSSKDRDFADIQAFTELPDLLTDLIQDSGLTMGELGNTDGKPSVTVTNPAGEKAHIAARGTPYLLRLSDGGQSRLDFLSYNERVDLKPPPAGLVIDLSG